MNVNANILNDQQIEFSNILKNQPQKVTYYMILLTYHFQNDKIIELENKSVVSKDSGIW